MLVDILDTETDTQTQWPTDRHAYNNRHTSLPYRVGQYNKTIIDIRLRSLCDDAPIELLWVYTLFSRDMVVKQRRALYRRQEIY